MNKNRTVEIWATPDTSAKEGYRFEMKANGSNTDELVFNKDTDNMKKKDNYQIEFILKNKGTKDEALRFSKEVQTVLWAKAVNDIKDQCPESACHMPGVFYVDSTVAIEDEKLTVINTDPAVQLFKFAFNFLRPGQQDGPTTDYATYDPIGSNQNGGEEFSLANMEVIKFTALGVGILAIAFVAYRVWW